MSKREFPPIHPGEILLEVALESLQGRLDTEVRPLSRAA